MTIIKSLLIIAYYMLLEFFLIDKDTLKDLIKSPLKLIVVTLAMITIFFVIPLYIFI